MGEQFVVAGRGEVREVAQMRDVRMDRRRDCLLPYFLCGLMLLCLGGCASLGSFNPATGRQEFIFVPTSDEVQMGQEVHARLKSEYQLADKDPRAQRLSRIGARVAQVSDRQDYEYHFFLLDKDEMNAFTTPGGNVYVFSGLMNKLSSDDQLAAVLAHEIGHCAARHTIKKFQAGIGFDFVSSLVSNTLTVNEQVKKLATLGSEALMNLAVSAYSRQDEYEADRLGVKYMDLAGFRPQGMVETFEILAREEKGGGPPLFLRTHPYLPDRIAAVKQEIARLPRD